MRSCASCAFWDVDHEATIHRADGGPLFMANRESLPGEDVATEERIEPGYLGRCTAPALKANDLPARGGAVVIDAEGYLAELLTTADFGCSLHEGRKPSDDDEPTLEPG